MRALVYWLFPFALLLSVTISQASRVLQTTEDGITTTYFLSPKFFLGAGSVENKFYYNIDFPRGHIALKEFNGEVVDELGNPVPLYETYLHHWLVIPYYGLKGSENLEDDGGQNLHRSKLIPKRNSGVCDGTLGQFFGLGSETRRTNTHVPDPYGIEVGNPDEIPDGYEERWLLNVHAIDTRGVEDRWGCTECKCDLYNVTVDEHGRPLSNGYIGGSYCCYDQMQCRLKDGSPNVKKGLYLRYKVKWVNWEPSILPVKIYIFDVTYLGKWEEDDTKLSLQPTCKIEYGIEACSLSGVAQSKCIDMKNASMVLPHGGYVVYGVAHQHSGGRGAALYGQDGQLICASMPVYGQGNKVGDEDGYIVGMSTCYPKPGSVKISDGEVLMLVSNYSSSQRHTGVMGLFYILVADEFPKPVLLQRVKFRILKAKVNIMSLNYLWAVVLVGLALIVIVGVGYIRKKENESNSYKRIVSAQ